LTGRHSGDFKRPSCFRENRQVTGDLCSHALSTTAVLMVPAEGRTRVVKPSTGAEEVLPTAPRSVFDTVGTQCVIRSRQIPEGVLLYRYLRAQRAPGTAMSGW
jgi:hypothetical protein